VAEPDDLTALRNRYIGAEPLSDRAKEALGNYGGLHLYDSSGGGVLPDVLPNATWTEMGAPWIDRAILSSSKFDGAKIYTWFQFNWELGGFAPEIDFFLQSRDFASKGGWQIILLRSGALKAVCTKYSNTEEFLGEAPEWRKLEAWIICIDHDLLYDTLALFAVFPLGLSSTLEAALGHLLRLLVYWPKEDDPDILLPNADVPAHLRNCLARKSEAAASLVDEFMTCDEEERESLETLLQLRSTKEFLDLYGLIEKGSPEFEKRRSYLLQSSESMMFHFLVGHELGHYLIDNRAALPSASKVYEWVDKSVLKDKPRPRRTLEECCSDLFGAANCMTQASRLEVPVTLAVATVDWVWLFAATRGHVGASEEEAYWQMLNNRRWAVFQQWKIWRSGSADGAAAISEDVFHLFHPAVPHIRSKVGIIQKINAILTGGGDPPRSMLTWIY
jgi:hypothetical protein